MSELFLIFSGFFVAGICLGAGVGKVYKLWKTRTEARSRKYRRNQIISFNTAAAYDPFMADKPSIGYR